MNYIKVFWKHSFASEPVWLYSELDAGRWEVRKVEIFRDGRQGFASLSESFGGTGLSKVPIPPLLEISGDPQFEPVEIDAEEFERIWANRRRPARGSA